MNSMRGIGRSSKANASARMHIYFLTSYGIFSYHYHSTINNQEIFGKFWMKMISSNFIWKKIQHIKFHNRLIWNPCKNCPSAILDSGNITCGG